MMEPTTLSAVADGAGAGIVIGMIVAKVISVYTDKAAVKARLYRAGTAIFTKIAALENPSPQAVGQAAADAAAEAEAKKQFQAAVDKAVA